jgi:hypothetical protein
MTAFGHQVNGRQNRWKVIDPGGLDRSSLSAFCELRTDRRQYHPQRVRNIVASIAIGLGLRVAVYFIEAMVSSMPCSMVYTGLYPSSVFAFPMSASECLMSPALSG